MSVLWEKYRKSARGFQKTEGRLLAGGTHDSFLYFVGILFDLYFLRALTAIGTDF